MPSGPPVPSSVGYWYDPPFARRPWSLWVIGPRAEGGWVRASWKRGQSVKLRRKSAKGDRTSTEVITGHCLLRKHLAQWKNLPNSCRLCGDTSIPETYHHLLTECPALIRDLICPALIRDLMQIPPPKSADIHDYFIFLQDFAQLRRVKSLRIT